MSAPALSWYLEKEVYYCTSHHVSRHLYGTTTSFSPKLGKMVFITPICEFQNQQETCKEIPPLKSTSKYDFNEDIQDMFYSKKTVFELQDWRHIFVYPWCKIWHSCVDTREIWSSTSITPAHNTSQKPFSISISLTWQWSTRITLKKSIKLYVFTIWIIKTEGKSTGDILYHSSDYIFIFT